jgi:hypothetical protein
MKFPTTLVFKVRSNFIKKHAPISKLGKSLYPVQNRKFSLIKQLSEIITPESLVAWGHVSNRWKAKKVFYSFYIQLWVRFWSQGHQNCHFLTVAQSGQIWQWLHFLVYELSPLPLHKLGLVFRNSFWANGKSLYDRMLVVKPKATIRSIWPPTRRPSPKRVNHLRPINGFAPSSPSSGSSATRRIRRRCLQPSSC